MIKNIEELKKSIECGYVFEQSNENNSIIPQLVVNNKQDNIKVSSILLEELQKCDEFYFSVAFITEGGVMQLLSVLRELESRNIKGKILASQYQNFTQPKALKRLLKLKNIELRVVTTDKINMHAKGYIFKKGDYYSILVGSSNLTEDALTSNLEWNLKISTHKDGHIAKNTLKEFQKIFDLSTVCDKEWLVGYENIYKSVRNTILKEQSKINDSFVPYPNEMQAQALTNLINLRKLGKDKALVISATGTGKTYLAAFDVNYVKPKKFLFIVHRERIAVEAMKAFKRVCDKDITMTLLGGGRNYDKNARFVFAMIETLNRDDTLHKFKQDEFDYILVDEAHHVCASTYVKTLNYFKPKFLLGMTATPDRADAAKEDKDVYKFFDYNIAYEIRLSHAMEMNLIAPFHYFGITDLTVNDEIIEDHSDFTKLVDEERIKHIIEQINYYGYSGKRVKGLVFCSTVEESEALSNKFNDLGYRTVYLSAKHSDKERAEAIERLEQDEYVGALDYIFLKDIFNEGIDIPEVNQVVMLRPTQSAIIFIQQLGRGLRKNSSKEFVVVLDFIGNYDKNFFIPVALSGNQTYSVHEIRKFVSHPCLPGSSTINFDQISKEKIYKTIDSSNFGNSKIIIEHYSNLKKRLGRIPNMMDFIINDSIDINKIIKEYNSYQEFLTRQEKEYKEAYTQDELKYFAYISKNFAKGHRLNEVIFLETLLTDTTNFVDDFKIYFDIECSNIKLTNRAISTVIKEFDGNFFINSPVFIKKDKDKYVLTEMFKKLIKRQNFITQVNEIIEVAKYHYKTRYSKKYKNTDLVLFEEYTRADVCKLLNFDKNLDSTLFGGKYVKETDTYPIFVTYNKAPDISDTLKYHDAFETNNRFIWTSTNVSIDSAPIEENNKISPIIKATKLKDAMPIFVTKQTNKEKKVKGGDSFYFIGFAQANDRYKEVKLTEKARALRFVFDLDEPVRNDIYTYLTSNTSIHENV